MSKRVCLVTGVGPGTGASMVRRFAEGGFEVAMLARDPERLAELDAEIDGASPFVCDVSDEAAIKETLAKVKKDLGAPEVLIHNAVRGTRGGLFDVEPRDFERNFQTNVMSLMHLARGTIPDMLEAGKGSIIVTGNTAARRGKPFFTVFAPTKAAQRIFAEALAREFGPQGIHVAFIVIDAVIDVPWTREAFKGKPDDFYIKPSAIADEAWHLVHQDKSCWSFDVDIRPFGETW